MLLLAAAVSDFYIPQSELPQHKIQSGGGGGKTRGGGKKRGRGEETSAAAADGGLTVNLRGVPKVLGKITEEWAPEALLVSFKLETNPNILMAKATGAIIKYGVDVVCANLLQSYKREMTIVTRQRNGARPKVVACGPLRGDGSPSRSRASSGRSLSSIRTTRNTAARPRRSKISSLITCI